MREPMAAAPVTIPLHAVWWVVLRPTKIVMANGQPGLEAVHQSETLAEATAHVRAIPGGLIVANVVVFVNPSAAPASLLKQ